MSKEKILLEALKEIKKFTNNFMARDIIEKALAEYNKEPEASEDCSNHKKDLFGETDMKKAAEAIGDLNYEAMAELYNHLAIKHQVDYLKNIEGHPKEAECLLWMYHGINKASYGAERALKISKPFMLNEKQNDAVSDTTGDAKSDEAGKQITNT